MRSHSVHKPEAKEGWQHNCVWVHWLLRMGGGADGKSPSLLESSRTNSLSIQGQGKINISTEKADSPFLCLLICSGPSHRWRRSSLHGLLIQMLISFRDTLTDILRNNYLPATWASFSPVKLIHKTSHHSRGSQTLGNWAALPKTFPKGPEIEPAWNLVFLSEINTVIYARKSKWIFFFFYLAYENRGFVCYMLFHSLNFLNSHVLI